MRYRSRLLSEDEMSPYPHSDFTLVDQGESVDLMTNTDDAHDWLQSVVKVPISSYGISLSDVSVIDYLLKRLFADGFTMDEIQNLDWYKTASTRGVN